MLVCKGDWQADLALVLLAGPDTDLPWRRQLQVVLCARLLLLVCWHHPDLQKLSAGAAAHHHRLRLALQGAC